MFRGQTTGKDIKIADNTIDAYLATPPEGKAKNGYGILYVPDVIGIWENSKLMADNFAAQGYTCLIPDLFNGDPVLLNRPDGFDLMQWIEKGTGGKNPHTAEAIDPIIVKSIKAMRDLGVTKLGAVGYCFGAKVSIAPDPYMIERMHTYTGITST